MNEEQTAWLNDYFLHVFGKLLSAEEAKLRKSCAKDLSIRELHVIEAVQSLMAEGDNANTMANTAHYLGVSPGSLTTAVNVLVRKGYLERNYTSRDRRVIYVSTTESGRAACEAYIQFVRDMVNHVGREMEEGTADALIHTLSGVAEFLSAPGN